MVYQIVYVSVPIEPLSASQISGILNTARSNNSREGITGLLIYHDNLFFQILEGEPTLVAACYSRITLDKRHTKLALMWEGEVAKRTFPNWTMGYCTPDELSPQCKDTLISLAKLKNDQGSVLVGNAVAVTLAKWIMREFPNVQ